MSSEIEDVVCTGGRQSLSRTSSTHSDEKLRKERAFSKKSSTSSIGSSPYLSFFSENPRVLTISESSSNGVGVVINFEEADEAPTYGNQAEGSHIIEESPPSPQPYFRRSKWSQHRLSPKFGGSQVFEQYQQDISERTQRGSNEDGVSPSSSSSISPRASMREGRVRFSMERRLSDSGRLAPQFERNILTRRSWNVSKRTNTRKTEEDSSLGRNDRGEGSKARLKGSIQKLGRKLGKLAT